MDDFDVTDALRVRANFKMLRQNVTNSCFGALSFLTYSLHAGKIVMLLMLSAIVCACVNIMRITQKSAGQGLIDKL